MSPGRDKRKHPLRRRIGYALQAAFALPLMAFLRILPLRWASAFGARLFRLVGPLLSADKVARRNLARAFPDWSKSKLDQTVTAMWDNLGRSAGEYTQIDRIDTLDNPDVEVVGADILKKVGDAGPFVVFSGHLANWEMASLVAAHRGYPLNNIYRAAENPWIDAHMRRIRSGFTRALLPKGGDGIRNAVKALKRGEPLGLLIDQKFNEGVPIPFFGRDAMTAYTAAELAIKNDCPLIPTRLERLGGPRFRVTIMEPLAIPDAPTRKEAAIAAMHVANRMLEDWVRERPEQWFWVHKRWRE